LCIPDISELLRNGFDEAVARDLYAQGEAVVVWVMLQLAVLAHQKAVASSEVHPSTPSGAIPVYQKEPSRKRCLLNFLRNQWRYMNYVSYSGYSGEDRFGFSPNSLFNLIQDKSDQAPTPQ
jgi:hypothetical protein